MEWIWERPLWVKDESVPPFTLNQVEERRLPRGIWQVRWFAQGPTGHVG